MNKTICVKCTHHREWTDSEGRELWKCEAPKETVTSFVTGFQLPVSTLCLVQNPSGQCRFFKAGEPPVVKSPPWHVVGGMVICLSIFAIITHCIYGIWRFGW